jgi:hypothetical protein
VFLFSYPKTLDHREQAFPRFQAAMLRGIRFGDGSLCRSLAKRYKDLPIAFARPRRYNPEHGRESQLGFSSGILETVMVLIVMEEKLWPNSPPIAAFFSQQRISLVRIS